MEICTEAHKRKIIPSFGKYSCFTTKKDGNWILKNSVGDIIYTFKNKEELQQKSQGMVDALFSMYIIIQKEFEKHRSNNPDYYIKTYEESNWVAKSIYRGFTSDIKDFNPYQNWFGVSVPITLGLYPDAVLKKGNKTIHLSLQGISMPSAPLELKKISKAVACKYVALWDGNNLVHESWTGLLPSNELLENFIN